MGRRIAAAAAILALALVAPASLAAGPAKPQLPDVATTRAERIALGLPADDQTIASLLGSSADVGTPEWGIAMTRSEASQIDLPGRMRFVRGVKAGVLPYAMSLSGFAGAYFDAASNGQLVIALLAPDKAAERAIKARMPAVSKGLSFVYRDVTERELRAALKLTETAWDEVLPGVRLNRAGINVKDALLFLEVEAASLVQARAAGEALRTALGVPVDIREAPVSSDTACSRDNCINPLRAGARIYKGAIHSLPPDCTMAFHVTVWTNGDEQFVTAGHCGYGGSNSWLHPGLPGTHVIGSEPAGGSLYQNNGQDIMRVNLHDSQASHLMIGDARVYQGISYPVQGDTVCDNRGYTNSVDCGSVTSSNVRWFSDTADIYVYGGSVSGISQVYGDSGSPLYERTTATQAWAVGVVAQSNGNFAILQDAQSLLSFEIYAP